MKNIQSQYLMRYEILLMAVLICVTGLFIMSCSKVDRQPPSEEIVESLIDDYSDPMDALGSGYRIERELIEITDIGEYNKKERYWPVKVKMSTQMIMHNVMSDQMPQPEVTEQIVTFRIAKDANGTWEIAE
ncbi:MAG: hypothetical protein ABH868_03190 [bacterium]